MGVHPKNLVGLVVKGLTKLAAYGWLHYLGTMNAIKSLMINIRSVLACVGEVVR